MSCIISTTTMNKYAVQTRAKGSAAVAATVLLAVSLVLTHPLTSYAEPIAGKDGRTPVAVVEQTARAALDIVKDKATSADQKKDKLQKLFTRATDVYTVSRLVLARNWKRLSENEQTEFQDVFCRHLSTTYGRNLDNYPNLDDFAEVAVKILGERKEARGDYTVMSKITRPNAADILVDYRLRKIRGNWKIIDVVIEGVSMISNFRSQFQDVVSKHGAKNLITQLREKEAKEQKVEAPPSGTEPASPGPLSATRPNTAAFNLTGGGSAP